MWCSVPSAGPADDAGQPQHLGPVHVFSDERAAPVTTPYQALAVEDCQRVAHRDTADPQLAGEIELLGKLRPGRKIPVPDALPQKTRHL
jgi:hypothetical protein